MDKKLYQRIKDIYSGAIGHEWKDGDEYLGAEELSRIIPALQSIFDPENKMKYHFQAGWNIVHFSDPEEATEYISDILKWMKDA